MLYAQRVTTDDLIFTGEAFAQQWAECSSARPAYAFIVSTPDEPQWPLVYCYFSGTPFTRRELRQLCQWDTTPLRQREAQGEPVVGFRWRLEEVRLEAASEEGEAILEAITAQEGSAV